MGLGRCSAAGVDSGGVGRWANARGARDSKRVARRCLGTGGSFRTAYLVWRAACVTAALMSTCNACAGRGAPLTRREHRSGDLVLRGETVRAILAGYKERLS